MSGSARSQYAKSNRLGVSDIGYCREYARRTITGQERDTEQTDYLAAFIGTAVGDRVEDLFVDRWPGEWIKQAEVVVTLEVSGYTLSIVGHPDLYSRSALIDFKTMDGLATVRSGGATDQQRFQLSLYAKALIAEGEMDEDAVLSLIYIDRSGVEKQPHVISWRYDPDIIREAEEWLHDVIYAVENEEEASRDKPRSWCEAVCEFAPSCRGTDTDVEGLIEDPIVLNAVDVYRDAIEREKQAGKDKKSAQSVLEHVNGSTGKHTIRWVDIGPSEVAFTRKGYRRLDIRPVPSPKKMKGKA
jgi:hypothetical protein